MATIGQELTTPEDGWRRIDDADQNFEYGGDSWVIRAHSGFFGGACHTSSPNQDELDMTVKFNFKGTKFRIITQMNNECANEIEVTIDGVNEIYTQYSSNTGATGTQRLVYEKINLEDKIHTVVIRKISTGIIHFDAIDIDKEGEILPYNPADEKAILLRVTMLDSSEREYLLPNVDVEGFVNWFNTHTSAMASSYKLTKNIGTRSSEEYLVFNKIISFEVSKF